MKFKFNHTISQIRAVVQMNLTTMRRMGGSSIKNGVTKRLRANRHTLKWFTEEVFDDSYVMICQLINEHIKNELIEEKLEKAGYWENVPERIKNLYEIKEQNQPQEERSAQ